MKTMKQYTLGDMVLRYVTDEKMHMGLEMFPASMENQVKEKNAQVDSLIQWKKAGDAFPYGFANGITMRKQRFCMGTEMEGSADGKRGAGDPDPELRLRIRRGIFFIIPLPYTEGREAVAVDVEIQNKSGSSFTIEMLSSFSLGGISVFAEDEGTGRLAVHKNAQQMERRRKDGKKDRRGAPAGTHLVPAWCVQRPVRTDRIPSGPWIFPFAAVEDTVSEVVWGGGSGSSGKLADGSVQTGRRTLSVRRSA